MSSSSSSMSANTQQHTLNLWGILSESKRIINAHSRHFLALSVFFLLPLSFSLIIYPSLQFSFFHQSGLNNPTLIQIQILTRAQTQLRDDGSLFLLVPLVYTLFALVLSILAIATISYSTFHGFYGRPVKLVSSIKSVLLSFFPLVTTLFVSNAIMVLITLFFVFALAFVVRGVRFVGFELSYDSNWFVGLVIVFGLMLVLVLIWLQVNWSLGYVIAVLESKWGYESLKRSVFLVKGMKMVALSVVLFFGVLISLLVGGCSSFLATLGEGGSGWTMSFGVIFQMVVSSGFATVLMLQSLAANVVLYMYCKAYRGELAFEIAEEFAREYVCLPFDNDKVPHVVCVVQD